MMGSVSYYWGNPTPLTPLTMRVMKWEGKEEVRRYLEAHGVQIEDKRDDRILTFPEGTLMERRLPFVWHDYFRLTLPDGALVYSKYEFKPHYVIGVSPAALKDFQQV
jgi:hypothetical protein